MDDADRLGRLAQLAVSVGANVQPGQLVVVFAYVDHVPMVREVARASYRAGARRVDTFYLDRHLTKALVELGPEESLGVTPPWLIALMRMLEDEHGAAIQITGEAEPGLMDGLDGTRLGKSLPRALYAEWDRIVGNRSVSWTIVPTVTPGWAQQVFGKPDVEALWQAVEKTLRLDRTDPVEAWHQHVRRLRAVAEALNERHFDSLRYRGPGTDFTVGLLPSSRWDGADTVTTFGVSHVANMPTEEVYTSPDRRRAEGKLRSTRPLELRGTVIRDLEFEFHDGRITRVRASAGEDLVRADIAIDANANRLGEVSLVDSSSEVGKLGLTFYNTLFDENATCHIAYGGGFDYLVGDETDRADGLNHSTAHTDFMVGGPEVEIDGKEPGGGWVPVIRDNEFQIS